MGFSLAVLVASLGSIVGMQSLYRRRLSFAVCFEGQPVTTEKHRRALTTSLFRLSRRLAHRRGVAVTMEKADSILRNRCFLLLYPTCFTLSPPCSQWHIHNTHSKSIKILTIIIVTAKTDDVYQDRIKPTNVWDRNGLE